VGVKQEREYEGKSSDLITSSLKRREIKFLWEDDGRGGGVWGRGTDDGEGGLRKLPGQEIIEELKPLIHSWKRKERTSVFWLITYWLVVFYTLSTSCISWTFCLADLPHFTFVTLALIITKPRLGLPFFLIFQSSKRRTSRVSISNNSGRGEERPVKYNEFFCWRNLWVKQGDKKSQGFNWLSIQNKLIDWINI
jgi:hypothetical protein